MQQKLKPLFSRNKQLLYFCLAWFILNLLQAVFTGLANDEAYYWMYARKLSIGYFDHPPMIAAMIKAGYWLLHSELGLRLFVVIFSTLTLPVLYRLVDKKDFTLLAFLFCGITVFQVYGFVAVPDAPLIFFTALFFLAYRNYLANDKPKEILALIVVIALLLYSKYHGFLVLFFTLVSNFPLLKRKSFYLVILGVIALYSPHIWWQIANDYPSYQYHVLNKSQSYYNPLDSLDFIGGTLLVTGPLTGWLLAVGIVKIKTKDPMLLAMRFTFIGFFVFFLASTFNAAVEANWMAASAVPLLIVGHHYLREKENLRKWAIRLAGISGAIFLFGRINLMTDIVPALGSKAVPEFYGWRKWAEEIKKHAQGKPVVIMNSYQRASKYSFYTGEDALSLNNVAYRRNQYDIWDIVDSMQGKNIALFMTYADGRDSLETFDTPEGKVQMLFIDNFISYTKIHMATDKDWYHFKAGTSEVIPLKISCPGPFGLNFNDGNPSPVSLVYERYYYEKFDQEIFLENLSAFSDEEFDVNPYYYGAKIHVPEKPGPYYIRFSIKTGWMPGYINSHLIRMDVE